MTGVASGFLGWPTSLPKDTDIQIFDVAGTYQWTKPAGAKWVKVTCVGAGSGGGSGAKFGNFNSVKTYLDGTGLVMRGVNGQSAVNNLASIPDNAAHRPTGDFELIVKMSADDWTPSTIRGIVWNGTGSGASSASLNYYFYLDINGRLNISRPAGTTIRQYTSTALGLADGTTKWVRVVFDADNGAGSSAATFYTSDNGITWTTISTSTVASTAAGNSTASPFKVGSDGSTTNMLAGKIFQVKMISNPLTTPVTVVDINFETQPADTLTFTESSSNAATVTITQAGAAKGGGGGGASGQVSAAEFAADALPGLVPVIVGIGSSGGARQTTNSANGANGNGSATSSVTRFGTFCGAACGSAGGFAGQSATAGGGAGVQTAYGMYSAAAGSNGGFTANATGVSIGVYNGGGSGGGGIGTNDIAYLGGLAGGGALLRPLSSGQSFIGLGGAGGTYNGVTPGDGQDGRYGGGGGGGSAGINGIVDSGAGGRGGDGVCIVTTYTGTAIDIQDFTASGTWRKPADPRLTTATVFVLGAGGGGGSGCRQPSTGSRCGAGAGGAGGASIITVPLSTLESIVEVTVGAGGLGAAAVTTDNTNGQAGGNGGTSSFGATGFARGGGGGAGGNTTGGTTGGLTGRGMTFSGPAGGNGSQPASDAASGSGSSSLTGSGGGGGGVRGAGSPGTQGSGGSGAMPVQRSVAASLTPVNTSATDITAGTGFFGGNGGGGGWLFSAATTPGGNGVRGGGGGGGCSNTNGSTAGNGGNGGNGRVVIVCR